MVNHIILNDVLNETLTDKSFKVIGIEKEINRCYLIELKTTKIEISQHPLTHLLEEIESGRFIIEDPEDNVPLKNFEDMSMAETITLQKRWQVIEHMIRNNNQVKLMHSNTRAKLIKDAVESCDIGKSAVYNYIRMYFQGGMNKLALLSRFNNCGARGKTKNYTKKPGRKNLMIKIKEKNPSVTAHEGVIINAYHRENILIALKRYHLKNSGISLSKTYQLMIRDLYTTNDKLGSKITKPAHNIPTIYQFYYHTKKLREASYEEFARKSGGDNAFNLKKRARLSNTVRDAFGPGFRYEIDATKPNIHMLDSSRKHVIGTPVVHLVMDSYSKMVVGMSVGLENAGWNGASSALFNCIEDKKAFAKGYDVDLSNTDWLNTSLPSHILADRGEFAGKLPENLIKALGISIENTPSYRGDLKGNIEKIFHLVEQELFGLVPGFSKANFRARGEIDENRNARFTLKDVTKAYILAIVKWNNTLMKNYPMTQQMLGDKLASTPANIWTWGITNVGSSMRNVSEKQAMLSLLRDGKATVTDSGVSFKGVNYYSKELIDSGWFIKARGEGRFKVDIRFDERNMDYIYLASGKSNEFTRLTQTPASDMSYQGLTMAEIYHYDEVKKIIRHERRDTENAIKGEFYDRVRSLSKIANKKYKLISGNDKPITKGKRENRKIEMESTAYDRALTEKVDKPDITDKIPVVPVAMGDDTKGISLAERKRLRMLQQIAEQSEE